MFGSNAGPGPVGQSLGGLAAGVWGDAGTFGDTGVLATADAAAALLAYSYYPGQVLFTENRGSTGFGQGARHRCYLVVIRDHDYADVN